MPTYEITLLLKTLPRTELTGILKRTANYIFDQGGFIRQINNLGLSDTPHKISNHGQVFKKANYFLIEFDTSSRSLESLKDSFSRDVDIIRKQIFKKNSEIDEIDCQLHEELQPPMYRKEVLQMIATANNKKEKLANRVGVYKHNTGLDYYPFQR